MAHMISHGLLSRKMEIFFDAKKEVSFNKDDGKWYWHDRGDTTMQGPFNEFLDAVNDAIEPLENPED